MKIRSFEDAEKYMANQQVYFKKEIVSIDFKTIAEELRVHNVGNVEVKRISDKTIAMSIVINGTETTIYQECSDKDFYSFINRSFITVYDLVTYWYL